jgi:hypothetical protein
MTPNSISPDLKATWSIGERIEDTVLIRLSKDEISINIFLVHCISALLKHIFSTPVFFKTCPLDIRVLSTVLRIVGDNLIERSTG